jgi:hypothetical protein
VFGATSFGGATFGGSAFSTPQVGRLPAFRVEVVSAPLRGSVSPGGFSRMRVSRGGKARGKGKDDKI